MSDHSIWLQSFRNVRDFTDRNRLDDVSYTQFGDYYQKIRFHSKGESLEHFLTKCAISKIIFNRRRAVSGEFLLRKNRQEVRKLDVIDFLEMNAYEVEGTEVVKDTFDINTIPIRLAEMPEEVKTGLKALQAWLEKRVV